MRPPPIAGPSGSIHDGGVIPTTRWARTVDGANIAYQDLGAGEITLVVIHGWISHLEVYWEQPLYVRFMERLAERMRVLTFDKRGTGMSDRFERPPDLGARMDDVRAVMDAAGVERAAIFGWGTGGPPLAFFFAATHPDRTIAVCTDPNILEKCDADYPWGIDEDAFQRDNITDLETWGDEKGADFINTPEIQNLPPDLPHEPAFRRWYAKFARYSATPRAVAAFTEMWYRTDIRDVLTSVRSPTMIFYRSGAVGYGVREAAGYLAARIPAARVVAVPGEGGTAWAEEPEPLVAAIESFLASVGEEEADFDRVLATVLFTDIVGSTEQASHLGDHAWRKLVEQHHQIVRALLARYRGVEIDTAGDGFFASFDGPVRAVRCARAITEALRPLGIEVRAGVHTGEIQTIGTKIGGIAVNIGARVGAIAEPSEVLVSQTVKDLIAGSGVHLEDAGEHTLKGVPDRWRLHRVTA